MIQITFFIIGLMTAAIISITYLYLDRIYVWVDPNLTHDLIKEALLKMDEFRRKHPNNRSIYHSIEAYTKRLNYLKYN